MVKLKNKIIKVESFPQEEKKKASIISIILTLLICIGLITCGYIVYIKLTPYIYSIKIEKIVGKKINITDCNTKDYIIINKDKTFNMNITNNNCKNKYYEGNLIIKDNIIIFKQKINKNDKNKKIKEITGTINSDYNIIINKKIFESEKHE